MYCVVALRPTAAASNTTIAMTNVGCRNVRRRTDAACLGLSLIRSPVLDWTEAADRQADWDPPEARRLVGAACHELSARESPGEWRVAGRPSASRLTAES